MNKQLLSLLVSFVDVAILILFIVNSTLPWYLAISLGCLLGSSILDLFAVRYKSFKKRKEIENKK